MMNARKTLIRFSPVKIFGQMIPTWKNIVPSILVTQLAPAPPLMIRRYQHKYLHNVLVETAFMVQKLFTHPCNDFLFVLIYFETHNKYC